MNQEYHCQALFPGDTKEVEGEDAADDKPARNPRQPGEDDQKTDKYEQENIFGGPKHHTEGQPGPQKVGHGNQFDPDTGNDDADASPNFIRPNDALGKGWKESLD